MLHHLINNSVQFRCLGFEPSKKARKMNRDAERFPGELVPAASASDVFNESGCASQTVLWSHRKPRATIAGNRRGSTIYT